MSTSNRIYGLDLARSISILIVTMGHCISAYNNGAHARYVTLEFIIRVAPPTFIIVFGVFLELVYASSAAKNGIAVASRRLISRSIQCYVLYVISCLVLSLAEGYSLSYTLRMAVLMGATPYTDILKFYSVMMFLAPFLIMIKLRSGFKPLVIFCAIVHISHYFLYPLPYPASIPGGDIMSGFLYGATTVIAGPSILHGLVMVIYGMWIGQVIRNNKDRDYLLDVKKPEVIFALCTCLALLAIGGMNYEGDYIKTLSSMEFRNRNSYIFFAFAIAGATVTMDVSMRITRWLGVEKIKPMLFLGGTSLFVFSFGNSLLYITRQDGLSFHGAVLASTASVLANVAMAWGYNRLRSHISSLDPSLPYVKAYLFMVKGYADALAAKLVNSKLAQKLYS